MTPVVILAGGKATRMGGGDKCLLPLGGRRVLDHILDRLDGPVAVNANGDPARFDLPVLPDPVKDQPGPLAGVLAGMLWAAELGADHVLSVAGDTPFFPRDLAQRLTPPGPVLVRTPGGPQPTFGLWPVALAEDLQAALEGGVRKITRWTDAHGGRFADWPDDAPFFNINTPEDLAAAELML